MNRARFAGFAGLPAQDRSVLLDELLELLPPWLELADAALEAPLFRDGRSGATWRLFTGGRVELGATPDRLAEVDALLTRFPMSISPVPLHVPVHAREVLPFLMRERVIEREPDEPWLVLIDRVEEETTRLLAEHQARLPTECEWEFAWRVVRRERAGWVAADNELCGDGWSAERWQLEELDRVPGKPGVVRSGNFSPDSFELVLPHRMPLSAARIASVRPTIEVPLT
ncbi:MAG: hypothetical protein U0228_29230 [Myxococcaceae bacterium]